jgi:hypothetical protein
MAKNASSLSRQGLVQRVRKMSTLGDLKELLPAGKSASWYRPGRRINVADKMQTRYSYALTEPVGKNFATEFKPELTPAQMLRRGVFEGKYLNDCVLEFPREWFADSLPKLRPGGADPSANEFKVKSRKSLAYWRKKEWIPIAPGDKDVRGWFQWYCRYYLGRRDAAVDGVQIGRWKAFTRHAGQIKASYKKLGNKKPKTRAEKKRHRPKQRQALLQWAYNPYI